MNADQTASSVDAGVVLTPQSPRSRRASANRASEVFCQHLAQRRDVQHRLRQQVLQLGILFLEPLQAFRVRYFHSAVFRAPRVECRIADPVLPAQVRYRRVSLVLLQHPSNLLLAKPRSLHRPSPDDGCYLRSRAFSGVGSAAFEEELWGRRYPAIAQSWRRAWSQVTRFYAFLTEVQRILYTTNAVETLNTKLRHAVRARRRFPSDDATMKLLFLVLNRSKRGGR